MTARPKANWGVQIPSVFLDKSELPDQPKRKTVGELRVGERAVIVRNGVVVDQDLRAYISSRTSTIEGLRQDAFEIFGNSWVEIERVEEGLRVFAKEGQSWKSRDLRFKESYLPVVEIVIAPRAES